MKLFAYTPIIVGGFFVVLFGVEKLFHVRESKAGLLARLIVNASLSEAASVRLREFSKKVQ